jgi:hypothetical protein
MAFRQTEVRGVDPSALMEPLSPWLLRFGEARGRENS